MNARPEYIYAHVSHREPDDKHEFRLARRRFPCRACSALNRGRIFVWKSGVEPKHSEEEGSNVY